jgi:hypothetical protein
MYVCLEGNRQPLTSLHILRQVRDRGFQGSYPVGPHLMTCCTSPSSSRSKYGLTGCITAGSRQQAGHDSKGPAQYRSSLAQAGAHCCGAHAVSTGHNARVAV